MDTKGIRRRTLRWLVSGTAGAILSTTATMAGAIDLSILQPPATITYERPRIEGYRVDHCESWSTNCGKPAADRFCGITRGYGSAATTFALEYDIGKDTPTRTLRDRLVCAETFCDGFRSITCSQPAPRVAEDPQPSICYVDRRKTFGAGRRRYVRGELVGQALVNRPEDKKESKINGRVVACFAGFCDTLGEVGVEGRSTGASRAYLNVIGNTVKQYALSGQSGKDFGPYVLEKKIKGSIPIVPGVKVGGNASFLAGAEFHAGYDIRALPPIADLNATGKAFANGTASGDLSVLGGLVGWAKADSVLTVPSPEVVAEVDTRTCGGKADARVDVKPWRLAFGVYGAVGCEPVLGNCLWKGSKVLVNETGSHKTYPLF